MFCLGVGCVLLCIKYIFLHFINVTLMITTHQKEKRVLSLILHQMILCCPLPKNVGLPSKKLTVNFVSKLLVYSCCLCINYVSV